MIQPEHSTGFRVALNEATGCLEAWVDARADGRETMIASCSSCLSEDEISWWSRMVATELIPAAGQEQLRAA